MASLTTSPVQVEKTKLKNPPFELHFLGDKVLRQGSKRITQVNEDTRQLARKMLQTMYSSSGIGLAAPQVGINKQLIVVDINPDEAANPPLILINPVIKGVSEEVEVAEEGCLSIPGVYLDVKRPVMIEVAYKDELGRPQVLYATELLARAILHEIDHLTGVMFVDRVENAIKLQQELKEHGFSRQAVRPLKA
ncbi:peptide deformylase [Synechococcus sp. PCC 6312]|uniref:peptide deformylase n=1 Tax=Synechococcus sp. (strain ATCC 27167 / PCC 6312) TaxID=195253 RepID=UPI00029EEF18|nr:peptide deformylase [Synechococcus sp. PCC 6312]AFY62440.1 peptide deformylase [Synechococcus sp. PCC 6312]